MVGKGSNGSRRGKSTPARLSIEKRNQNGGDLGAEHDCKNKKKCSYIPSNTANSGKKKTKGQKSDEGFFESW